MLLPFDLCSKIELNGLTFRKTGDFCVKANVKVCSTTVVSQNLKNVFYKALILLWKVIVERILHESADVCATLPARQQKFCDKLRTLSTSFCFLIYKVKPRLSLRCSLRLRKPSIKLQYKARLTSCHLAGEEKHEAFYERQALIEVSSNFIRKALRKAISYSSSLQKDRNKKPYMTPLEVRGKALCKAVCKAPRKAPRNASYKALYKAIHISLLKSSGKALSKACNKAPCKSRSDCYKKLYMTSLEVSCKVSKAPCKEFCKAPCDDSYKVGKQLPPKT